MLNHLRLLASKALWGLWLLFWYIVIGEPQECGCPKCELRRMAERGKEH